MKWEALSLVCVVREIFHKEVAAKRRFYFSLDSECSHPDGALKIPTHWKRHFSLSEFTNNTLHLILDCR